MRAEESKYWDHVAVDVKMRGPGGLSDNIRKRCIIVSQILAHCPVDARVLEIGMGQALGAATVNLVTLGNFRYIGTDVSEEFCKWVFRRWKLSVAHTDILKLPDGPFDMVWAFDSLEHVRPEDRESGYREINRVMAERGVILLNIPCDKSEHEEEFDWGYGREDAEALARVVGGRISVWEPYTIEEFNGHYVWCQIDRG